MRTGVEMELFAQREVTPFRCRSSTVALCRRWPVTLVPEAIGLRLGRRNELRVEMWMRVFKDLRHQFTPPFPYSLKPIVLSDIAKSKTFPAGQKIH
jgi:hypothetical protein